MIPGTRDSGTNAVAGAVLCVGAGGEPCGEGQNAELFVGLSPAREECERQLLDAGVMLPLPHRSVWAASYPDRESWFLAVRDPAGRCTAGCALEVTTTRALPGHRVLRVEKFGAALTEASRAAAVEALALVARRLRRVLRLHLEVFSRDPAVRDQVASAARACGFRRPARQRMYVETPIVELAQDEPTMLAALSRRVRRGIQEVAKHQLAVRPITDPAAAPRMQQLMAETMQRTGGVAADQDWGAFVALAATHPTLARVVGTMRTDVDAAEALLAFRCARAHGDHIEDYAAASTRLPGERVGLMYPLVWDLMCWGRGLGATWMDFGGVTAGSHGSSDPLGGISDFKRAFSKTQASVGDEWVLEPHRGRAVIANLAAGVGSWLRGR